MSNPVECAYAPPGEYLKDHSLVLHDGWWHLFNISGTAGYYHGYTGNEETVAWSVSRDLVHWEFRGHVLHASQWTGFFDQHEVWAPFCLKTDTGFLLFYTGVVHPMRPMEYRRLGHLHPWVAQGHRETQGIAASRDLTEWVKISDPARGAEVPGRDAHVVHDDARGRWLLYSTIGSHAVNVCESTDLLHWLSRGPCAELPELTTTDAGVGATTRAFIGFSALNTAESVTVMRRPTDGRWLLLANWHCMESDDPMDFTRDPPRRYDSTFNGDPVDMGYACEIVNHEGRWYRSGVFGPSDQWKLGFTEIEWGGDTAFRVRKPSVLNAGA
jgi:hypothetical protein